MATESHNEKAVTTILLRRDRLRGWVFTTSPVDVRTDTVPSAPGRIEDHAADGHAGAPPGVRAEAGRAGHRTRSGRQVTGVDASRPAGRGRCPGGRGYRCGPRRSAGGGG